MLESKWGLRFIAFLLALFFFLSVNNVFGNIFNTGNLGQKSSKTIQDVPVEILYNTKDLHLTKAPETVNVTISGPQSKIIKIENPENLRVVIDLSNAKAGKYQEKYQVKGLADDIHYSVKPKLANITLENKVTKKMTVQPDVSQSDIDPLYKITKQEVSPQTVKVTGGEEQLNDIAYLKATFKTNKKINGDTKDIAEVTAFDKKLNKLNISIQPNEVNLQVKVEPFSKKVKVNVKQKGSLADDKELSSIDLEDKEIEIFGSRDDLQNISEVDAEVDLDGISESTEKTVKINLPEHVSKAEPSETKAYIKVK
ncbi:TPA: YbbR-like domain-containing protein [Staphylococcus aureus]|nr:YbbR-like domain-containing protein [Staphylococcus aureus]